MIKTCTEKPSYKTTDFKYRIRDAAYFTLITQILYVLLALHIVTVVSKCIRFFNGFAWCIKGTEESTLDKDCSVSLMHHDPSDLELISLVKKRRIRFWILESNLGFS